MRFISGVLALLITLLTAVYTDATEITSITLSSQSLTSHRSVLTSTFKILSSSSTTFITSTPSTSSFATSTNASLPHTSTTPSGLSFSHVSAANSNATGSAISSPTTVVNTHGSVTGTPNSSAFSSPPQITASPSIDKIIGKFFKLPPGSGIRPPGSGGFPITAGPRFGSSGQPLRFIASTTNASYSTNSSLLASCRSVYDTYWTSLQHAYVNTLPFTGTYSRAAVCSAILETYCEIWVDGVDALYWPTPYATAGPNATMTKPRPAESSFVSDQFTFAPQSAYLAYLNLKAILPYNTLSSTTGPFYPRHTIGYPQESLSTFYDCNPAGFWPYATINYEDYNRPPKWSVVSSQRGCHPAGNAADSLSDQTFPPSELATQYTDYVNQPDILLPELLTYVDPAWSTCVMGDTDIGLSDPAIALDPENALVTPTPNPISAAGEAEPDLAAATAQPASSISCCVPTQTTVALELSNGDTIIDYAPVGASNLPQDTQNAQDSANTGVLGDRPLPFNPGQVASPEPSSLGSESNQGGLEPEGVVASPDSGAGSASSPAIGPIINSGSGFVTNPDDDSDESSKESTGDTTSDSNQNGLGSGGSSSVGSNPSVEAGGYTIETAPDGGVLVNGVKLNSASATDTATVGGVQLSLHDSGIVVGGNIIAAAQAAVGSPVPPISLNGHNLQVSMQSSGPQLYVDGKAIPGRSSQANVGGTVVSVMSDGQIYVLPTTLPYVPVAVPGEPSVITKPTDQALTPQLLSNGEIEVAGTILSVGGTTISGIAISVLPSREGIVIGSKTISPIPTSPPSRLGLFVAGQTFTPVGDGRIVVDGTTLSTNGQSIQLQNKEEATLQDGALIVGTRTVPIPVAADGTATFGSSKFVIDGATFTPVGIAGNAGIAVDGITLSKAGQSLVLADGTTVSLQKDGALVIGSQTLLGPGSIQTDTAYWNQDAMSVGALQTLSNGDDVYDGITLSRGGPAVTLPNGQVISLEGSQSTAAATRRRSSAAASKTTIAGGVNVSKGPQLQGPAATSSAVAGNGAAIKSDGTSLGLGALHDRTSIMASSFCIISRLISSLMPIIVIKLLGAII